MAVRYIAARNADIQKDTKVIERSDNVTRNDKNNLIDLLKLTQDTINHMASDLNEHDLDCYYCAHFPEGGDGKCPMYADDGSDGWCHFRWRLADEMDNAVEKLQAELESPIVTLQ